MLSTPYFPREFWGEAIKATFYICNQSPEPTLKGGISKHVWSGQPAINDYVRIFRWNVFAQFREDFSYNLDGKSIKVVFIKYGDEGEIFYIIWLLQFKNVVCSWMQLGCF